MASVAALITQHIYVADSFTLECGTVLNKVPVAYKTWGSLNEARDNVMIICHAFTGSADVEDWWGPLIGRGKAFDPRRYLIFCANVLGSPYGTASPITLNPNTAASYGPEFPPTTIRDDVRLHKQVLDHLNVRSVAVAIGGSMGGMAVLEWPLCSPPGYIRHIIPLATSARHSAWCISWGEAQRQSIYSDPDYKDGYYDHQPASGLAAARMSALLTYRSRDSFENRFGRNPQLSRNQKGEPDKPATPPQSPRAAHFAIHNEGHRNAKTHLIPSLSAAPTLQSPPSPSSPAARNKSQIFSAQSYLRYQGDKFITRFDANCYIHITRKMDTHDLARGRGPQWTPCPHTEGSTPQQTQNSTSATLPYILSLLPQALVISIESDGLFTPSEQRELAAHIPKAELVVIPSPDGHDGFLLEFEAINGHLLKFLKKVVPQYYRDDEGGNEIEGFEVKKTSVFGEAEVDVTRW